MKLAPKLRLPAILPEPHQVRPLSGKPSIAALPFQTLSDYREQEYFVDGNRRRRRYDPFKDLRVDGDSSQFELRVQGAEQDIREIG